MSARRIASHLPLLFVVLLGSMKPGYGQISSEGRLGTVINSNSIVVTEGGTCSAGVCTIEGGTNAGQNKFHRFTSFDTRNGIDGVNIITDSKTNLILGIAAESGFHLDVPLDLVGSKANLFIVSPYGISLSTGASFSNVMGLTLTNQMMLPVGTGQFSPNSSLDEVQLLTGAPSLNLQNSPFLDGPTDYSIEIDGVTISIDDSLYVHANSAFTLSDTSINASAGFVSRGALDVSYSEFYDNASISFYTLSDLSIYDSDFDGNTSLAFESLGNIDINNTDINDNAWLDVNAGGDFYFYDANLIGNFPFSNSKSYSYAEVTALSYFMVTAEGDVDIYNSSIDENGPFDLISYTGDVSIDSSDFIGNLYPYVESESGDVFIVNSSVLDNRFIDVYAKGDAIIDGSDIAGNDLVIGSEQGDVIIADSDIIDNILDSFSKDGDAVIFDSYIDNNFLSLESEFGDSMIFDSDISDSDVFVTSGEGDSLIADSNVDNSLTNVESENGGDTSENSDSVASSDSATEGEDDSGSDNSNSSSSKEDTDSSQSSDINSSDSSSSSFKSTLLDTTTVTSNLQGSIDLNASQVSSALGLDDLTPTPTSELTPARISQSLNDARNVFGLSLSSVFPFSNTTIASNSSIALMGSSQATLPFNPAYLNIAFTKNSDLGSGDPNNGLIDLTLITSSGTVVGRRTEIPLSQFSSLLRGFYGKITSQRSLQPELNTSESSKLYSLFLQPLEEVLLSENITSVLVSADRGLQAIPFTALARQGSFIVNRITFSLTPSLALTDLSVPFTGHEHDQILVMGASEFNGLAPLPYVNQELENINKLYNSSAVIDDDFTSNRLVSDLQSSSHPLVHLATHADFKGGRPHESMIHTRDGFVTLDSFKDIRRQRKQRPIELFVLSACRSALGDKDSEMGLAGMALQAGAKSAVGSLWYVDDVATSAFFSLFYKYLRDGMTKSVALGFTQRDFAAGKIKIIGSDVIASSGDVLLSGLSTSQKYNYPNDFRHPFFWSGFVLLGTPW